MGERSGNFLNHNTTSMQKTAMLGEMQPTKKAAGAVIAEAASLMQRLNTAEESARKAANYQLQESDLPEELGIVNKQLRRAASASERSRLTLRAAEVERLLKHTDPIKAAGSAAKLPEPYKTIVISLNAARSNW